MYMYSFLWVFSIFFYVGECIARLENRNLDVATAFAWLENENSMAVYDVAIPPSCIEKSVSLRNNKNSLSCLQSIAVYYSSRFLSISDLEILSIGDGQSEYLSALRTFKSISAPREYASIGSKNPLLVLPSNIPKDYESEKKLQDRPPNAKEDLSHFQDIIAFIETCNAVTNDSIVLEWFDRIDVIMHNYRFGELFVSHDAFPIIINRLVTNSSRSMQVRQIALTLLGSVAQSNPFVQSYASAYLGILIDVLRVDISAKSMNNLFPVNFCNSNRPLHKGAVYALGCLVRGSMDAAVILAEQPELRITLQELYVYYTQVEYDPLMASKIFELLKDIAKEFISVGYLFSEL